MRRERACRRAPAVLRKVSLRATCCCARGATKKAGAASKRTMGDWTSVVGELVAALAQQVSSSENRPQQQLTSV